MDVLAFVIAGAGFSDAMTKKKPEASIWEQGKWIAFWPYYVLLFWTEKQEVSK